MRALEAEVAGGAAAFDRLRLERLVTVRALDLEALLLVTPPHGEVLPSAAVLRCRPTPLRSVPPVDESILRRGVAEFIGTFTLIFIGGGAGIAQPLRTSSRSRSPTVSRSGSWSRTSATSPAATSTPRSRSGSSRPAGSRPCSPSPTGRRSCSARSRPPSSSAFLFNQIAVKLGSAPGVAHHRREGVRLEVILTVLPRVGGVGDRRRPARRVQGDRRSRDRPHDHDRRLRRRPGSPARR